MKKSTKKKLLTAGRIVLSMLTDIGCSCITGTVTAPLINSKELKPITRLGVVMADVGVSTLITDRCDTYVWAPLMDAIDAYFVHSNEGTDEQAEPEKEEAVENGGV